MIHAMKRKFCLTLLLNKNQTRSILLPPNYIPGLEDAPILTNNLIPNPTPEKSRNTMQNEKVDKLIEDKRIVIELTGEEDD